MTTKECATAVMKHLPAEKQPFMPITMAFATRLHHCEKESAPAWTVGAGCEIPLDCQEASLHAMRKYAQRHK